MTGHILPTRRVWLLVAGTAVLAMVTGLLVWVAVGGGCDGAVRLSVSAAPDIAPAVRKSAAEWVTEQPHVGGTCVAPRITTVDPARVAAALNHDRGGDLDVADVAAERAGVPDVWIPDSSSWLTRVRTIDRQAFVGGAPSIAMSPVVLALPEPAARAEGWPAEAIGWEYVLAGMKADPPLRFGMVEPRRSAVGLSGLLLTGRLAASAAKISDRDAETAVLGTYRGLSLHRAATTDELLGRLPRHPSESEGRLGAALLSEHDVQEYDASDPDVRLAAVYPEPAAPALDYPYATMTGLSTAESEAAGQFRRWLLGKKSRRLLTGHGFRTPDGATGPNFRTGDGVTPEPVPPPRSITADDVTTALGLWTELSMSSRVLAVLDVSPSMAEPVPTAKGLSRLEVTRRAAAAGLPLFTDDTQLGLWVFSTGLDGTKDHREVAPVADLQSNRKRLEGALKRVGVVSGGGTGLFDTIGAAYRTMVEDYDPERSNTIVVMTDGRNQDPSGMSERELLRELARLSDPERPVHLVVIGIGKDVDEHQMNAVTKATGGAVYLAPDPSKIGEIFLRALALPSR